MKFRTLIFSLLLAIATPTISWAENTSYDAYIIEALQTHVDAGQTFRVSDLHEILSQIYSDENRKIAARLVYPNLTDKENWDKLASAFGSSEIWEQVKNNPTGELIAQTSQTSLTVPDEDTNNDRRKGPRGRRNANRLDVDAYVQHLNTKYSDSSRLDTLQELIHTQPRLTVSDVKPLLATFTDDAERASAAVLLYPLVDDKANWYQLENSFTLSTIWKEVKTKTSLQPVNTNDRKFDRANNQRPERNARKKHEDAFDTTSYVEYLSSQSSDAIRLDAIQQLAKTQPALTVDDVKSMLAVFTFDKDRMTVATLLYPCVTNPSNWYKLSSSFTQQSSWAQVADPTEHSIHLNTTPSPTVSTFNALEFAQNLSSKTIDTDRLADIEKFVQSGQAITVNDIKIIIGAFALEAYRSKAATMLYPLVQDKQNWETLSTNFSPATWLQIQTQTQHQTTASATTPSTTNSNIAALILNTANVPAETSAFQTLLENLTSQMFDVKRQDILSAYLENKPTLTVAQLAQILSNFQMDDEKVKAALAVRPYVQDLTNWNNLESAFEDKASWTRLNRRIENPNGGRRGRR